jgi:hypothetical protein
VTYIRQYDLFTENRRRTSIPSDGRARLRSNRRWRAMGLGLRLQALKKYQILNDVRAVYLAHTMIGAM